jgi:HAD superfamily hydrolase (TIGR01509 family)
MKLELPPGDFGAYLFDCDGTIADTMPLHFDSWNAALAPWGGRFSEELFYAWAGISFEETIRRLNEKYGLALPGAEVKAIKERRFNELVPGMKPVESVLEHIVARAGKIPFAVVSGSSRAMVAHTLEVLGLVEHFPVIVGAEDSARGKPFPDPFLRAAKLLGVRPENCLVFEDADLGIESARAAGMAWVRVPSPRDMR